MTALAQPDTRISEGVSDKGMSAPSLSLSQPVTDLNTVRRSLERNVATQTGISADAAENTASPLEFKPQLMHRDVTNDTGLKKLFQFPIDPLWGNYYTVLRAGGYAFNTLFPTLKKTFDRFGKTLPDEAGSMISALTPDLASTKAGGSWFLPNEYTNTKDPSVRKILYLETATFTALGGYYSSREFINLFDNCKLALAAELGKAEQEVTWRDIFNTDNPIISTEVNRLAWKTTLRLGSGLGYLHSLEAGVLLGIANISAERTAFNVDSAYDMTAKTVNDVQLNHLTGEAIREDIINGLQRIMQRTTIDHNRTPMDEEELHRLRPIFSDIAQDITDKRIGIASVIGYLGGGIIIPGEPEQSRANYEYVKQHGLASMAADGAERRERLEIAENQPIWRRYEPEVKEERADVAESAKRAKTLSDRYGMDASRAAHLGSSPVR